MISIALIVVLAIAGSTFAQSNPEGYNYYWRQYLGEIPPDAIVGGHDANGKETYIGQAYIISSKLKSRSAIIPVEIHQGIASVDVPIFGVRENTTTDIKILCGPEKHYFQFYMTDSRHIFDQMKGKHLIPGGTEDNGITNIGRLTYGRQLKIGKVDTFKGYGEAKIYFADYASELRSDVYQVLVYEDETFMLAKQAL